MLSEEQIAGVAAKLKFSLSSRARRLVEIHTVLAHYSAGIAPDIKPERAETMRSTLATLEARQAREGLIYATLRWVVGGANGINDQDLDLQDVT